MLGFIGESFIGVGRYFLRLSQIRWLLQYGTLTEGKIRSITEKTPRGRSVVLEYEHQIASIRGELTLYQEDRLWQNKFSVPEVSTKEAPKVGDRIKILYNEKRAHQHVVIGIEANQ
jgi:hypothetical protein